MAILKTWGNVGNMVKEYIRGMWRKWRTNSRGNLGNVGE